MNVCSDTDVGSSSGGDSNPSDENGKNKEEEKEEDDKAFAKEEEETAEQKYFYDSNQHHYNTYHYSYDHDHDHDHDHHHNDNLHCREEKAVAAAAAVSDDAILPLLPPLPPPPPLLNEKEEEKDVFHVPSPPPPLPPPILASHYAGDWNQNVYPHILMTMTTTTTPTAESGESDTVAPLPPPPTQEKYVTFTSPIHFTNRGECEVFHEGVMVPYTRMSRAFVELEMEYVCPHFRKCLITPEFKKTLEELEVEEDKKSGKPRHNAVAIWEKTPFSSSSSSSPESEAIQFFAWQNESCFWSILFQLFYTLYVLECANKLHLLRSQPLTWRDVYVTHKVYPTLLWDNNATAEKDEVGEKEKEETKGEREHEEYSFMHPWPTVLEQEEAGVVVAQQQQPNTKENNRVVHAYAFNNTTVIIQPDASIRLLSVPIVNEVEEEEEREEGEVLPHPSPIPPYVSFLSSIVCEKTRNCIDELLSLSEEEEEEEKGTRKSPGSSSSTMTMYPSLLTVLTRCVEMAQFPYIPFTDVNYLFAIPSNLSDFFLPKSMWDRKRVMYERQLITLRLLSAHASVFVHDEHLPLALYGKSKRKTDGCGEEAKRNGNNQNKDRRSNPKKRRTTTTPKNKKSKKKTKRGVEKGEDAGCSYYYRPHASHLKFQKMIRYALQNKSYANSLQTWCFSFQRRSNTHFEDVHFDVRLRYPCGSDDTSNEYVISFYLAEEEEEEEDEGKYKPTGLPALHVDFMKKKMNGKNNTTTTTTTTTAAFSSSSSSSSSSKDAGVGEKRRGGRGRESENERGNEEEEEEEQEESSFEIVSEILTIDKRPPWWCGNDLLELADAMNMAVGVRACFLFNAARVDVVPHTHRLVTLDYIRAMERKLPWYWSHGWGPGVQIDEFIESPTSCQDLAEMLASASLEAFVTLARQQWMTFPVNDFGTPCAEAYGRAKKQVSTITEGTFSVKFVDSLELGLLLEQYSGQTAEQMSKDLLCKVSEKVKGSNDRASSSSSSSQRINRTKACIMLEFLKRLHETKFELHNSLLFPKWCVKFY